MSIKFEYNENVIKAFCLINYRIIDCIEAARSEKYLKKNRKFFFFYEEVFDMESFEKDFSDIENKYTFFIYDGDRYQRPKILRTNEYDILREISLTFAKTKYCILSDKEYINVANNALIWLESNEREKS